MWFRLKLNNVSERFNRVFGKIVKLIIAGFKVWMHKISKVKISSFDHMALGNELSTRQESEGKEQNPNTIWTLELSDAILKFSSY